MSRPKHYLLPFSHSFHFISTSLSLSLLFIFARPSSLSPLLSALSLIFLLSRSLTLSFPSLSLRLSLVIYQVFFTLNNVSVLVNRPICPSAAVAPVKVSTQMSSRSLISSPGNDSSAGSIIKQLFAQWEREVGNQNKEKVNSQNELDLSLNVLVILQTRYLDLFNEFKNFDKCFTRNKISFRPFRTRKIY